MSNKKDIVIAVGGAIGSTLALAEGIRSKVSCKVYIITTRISSKKILSKSKFVDEVYLIHSSDEKHYVKELKQWYSTKAFANKPIFYATNDNSAFYINNNRDWFEQHFKISLPSSKIITTYTKKGAAEEAAQSAGLTVPKTLEIKSEEDVEYVKNNFKFPIILKPLATYLDNQVNFKLKVYKDKEEFQQEVIKVIDKGGGVLCQEYIMGSDDNVYYYLFYRTKEGEIYESMGKKIYQTTQYGGLMAKGISSANAEISNISRKFLEQENYEGFGGIEYKYFNGFYFFIELNVRVEAILKTAEKSGIPLSLISYYDICNNLEGLSKFQGVSQKEDVVYVDFLRLLSARIKRLQFFLLFKDFFQILFRSKVYLNIFSKKDLKPFFYYLFIR